jgi:hypothetical protein
MMSLQPRQFGLPIARFGFGPFVPANGGNIQADHAGGHLSSGRNPGQSRLNPFQVVVPNPGEKKGIWTSQNERLVLDGHRPQGVHPDVEIGFVQRTRQFFAGRRPGLVHFQFVP